MKKRLLSVFLVLVVLFSFLGSTSTVANAATNTVDPWKIVNKAQEFYDWPYVWGGNDPSCGGFDCGGFVSYVLRNTGFSDAPLIGSNDLYDYCLKNGKEVSPDDIQVGDIAFFFNPGHVGICISNTEIIHAPYEGATICDCSLSVFANRHPTYIRLNRVDGPCEQYYDMPTYGTTEHKALDFAIARGIINGTSSTKVSPYETLTRAQLVTILYRMAGSPKINPYWTGPRYRDVRTTDWYYLAAVWAYHTGIMRGTGSTTFSPNVTLNNETTATVLYRYAKKMGHSITGRTSLNGLNVSDWAKDAYSWAVANSMIGRCNAKNSITRAEFAVAVYRYYKVFGTLK